MDSNVNGGGFSEYIIDEIIFLNGYCNIKKINFTTTDFNSELNQGVEAEELLDEFTEAVPYTKDILDVATQKGKKCKERVVGLEKFPLKFLHKNLRYEGPQRRSNRNTYVSRGRLCTNWLNGQTLGKGGFEEAGCILHIEELLREAAASALPVGE